MTTNTSITLFHQVPDKVTRAIKWEKYHIENVMWQGGEGASINKGYEKANDITLFIPYEKNPDLDNIPIKKGDIIVEGLTNQSIKMQSDLKMANYNITTLIKNKYGSYDMHHIFIGAK